LIQVLESRKRSSFIYNTEEVIKWEYRKQYNKSVVETLYQKLHIKTKIHRIRLYK